jgi:hypothetical protein
MGGDFFRGVLGRAAFDAEGNDVRIGKRGRIDPIVDVIGLQRPLPSAIIADRQSVFADIVGETLSPDEADVETGGLPASADEAADRAGTENGDLGQPRPR